MNNMPTNELDEMLSDLKPADLDNFYLENREHLANGCKTFYYYFKDIADSKNIKLKDIYSFAGFSEGWGSKLVTMEKHTKDRNQILRLCVAGHFMVDEVNRALKLYGMSPLYAKDRRDAAIIVALNNRIMDVYELDAFLTEKGFEGLGVHQAK